MYFKQIAVKGLGCLSYVIGCPAAGEMIVVDPKRDVSDYLEISRNEGMKITKVFETHVHADHVSGNQELRSRTGCEILMYETSPVSFDFTPLKEGDTFEIGASRIEVIHTPGHTPDAASYLVTDLSRGEEPWMLLTGDLLFVGDIGRPDLVGEAKLDEQIHNLWNSLHVKLDRLPDYLEVFPAHGMGSLCGKGMSSKLNSTLGFERKHNPMVAIKSYEDFEKAMKGEFPLRPKSFSHIISTNMKGAPLLERCPIERALEPMQFEKCVSDGAVIVDVRDSAAFSGFHIPGSLNIGFEKQLANWVGMVVEPGAEMLLVVDNREDYEAMSVEMHRIGYDNIIGYLSGGISSWVYSGRPVDKLMQYSVNELSGMIDDGLDATLVDVRTPAEVSGGKIAGSVHVPLTQILSGNAELPTDKPIIVYCLSGYRSNIAASYLQRHGHKDVRAVAGGFLSWSRAGMNVS